MQASCSSSGNLLLHECAVLCWGSAAAQAGNLTILCSMCAFTFALRLRCMESDSGRQPVICTVLRSFRPCRGELKASKLDLCAGSLNMVNVQPLFKEFDKDGSGAIDHGAQPAAHCHACCALPQYPSACCWFCHGARRVMSHGTGSI